MSIIDIFRVGKIKRQLESVIRERDNLTIERDNLQDVLSETGAVDYHDLKQSILHLSTLRDKALTSVKALEENAKQKELEIYQKLSTLQQDVERKHNDTLKILEYDRQKKEQVLRQQLNELEQQITIKKNDLVEMDEGQLLQSFGFYKPRYSLSNSEAYSNKLKEIRMRQQTMVKNDTAATCSTTWTVNNSQREGEKMVRDYQKLILRSFNNECDASIINVKFNNIESIEKRIQKAFDILNKLGTKMSISISQQYLNLKLEELYLCYEYALKKQEEKEEQKLIREQMREEAKALKEIEELKAKLGKEEKHFSKALAAIEVQFLKAKSEAERISLEQEKSGILQNLEEIEKNKEDILYREQNTRAGYVYIVSNIGSFGENIYKIGVTRRLDPQERVDELGDASVPFGFDVHAMIFSDDAPTLENALHRAFETNRLNLINRRREFFRVTLDEIKQVVHTNFNKPVEFIDLADAQQFRESLVLKGSSI
jgi:regulator of replication initiation timing